MFVIGLLLMIAAGVFAVWYVLGLQGNLRNAKLQLRQTQLDLVDARRTLASAKATLRQSQAAANPANQPRIAAAIKDVTVSQQTLTNAASSLSKATAALPTPGTTETAGALSGTWADQFGTVYTTQQAGSSFSYQASFKNAAALGPAAHGSAQGEISGRRLIYTYSDGARNRYRCQSTVSPDFQRIEETCIPPTGEPLHVTLIRL